MSMICKMDSGSAYLVAHFFGEHGGFDQDSMLSSLFLHQGTFAIQGVKDKVGEKQGKPWILRYTVTTTWSYDELTHVQSRVSHGHPFDAVLV